MQHRITKSCQIRKNKRADRLRDLLQLTPSDSILLDACARKPLNDVKVLLEALPATNPDTIRDKYLRTPLHIACGRKDDFENATAIARLLIKAGSDVNNGVGDVDGLQPIHMAVLVGNHQCVLMLLHEGVNIPASDPFRLTPLLLAKLKLDNLRHTQHSIHSAEDDQLQWTSESAMNQYDDITQVLVSHLANKHITTYGLPSYDTSGYHGLSDFLFSKQSDEELSNTISSITDKLASIGMSDVETDDKIIQDSMTGWQTRLAFPVIPRDQWEFPTMPPESTQLEDPSSVSLDGNSTTRSSTKRKEGEVVVKSEDTSVKKLPSPSPPPPKRKPRTQPKPKSRAQRSNRQSPSSATEVPSLPTATAVQALNTNQTEDDELVYIKSEDTDMAMPTISRYLMLPDPDDQNFYCRACNGQKPSRASYRHHLKHVHKMQLTALQPMLFTPKTADVRPEVLPNVYDPYFYCRVCKKRYKDAISYRRHCQNYHGIQLTRIISIPDPNIEPDPDDPMHHCRACSRSYETRSIYRDHLRRVHKTVLEPACNPANLDRSKGFVCRFCNETFEEGRVYGAHLQANHQGKLEKR
ncbi:hypothetical protein MAM1_0072d04192 [Mucor ambiguus]|uniref:C2H2-type domain-containing protein n=1 Tax=Mucor ambiguus TaxID=91626 RepID=A0A0C9MRS3_9FUNG|nr:hypothetical protein MAM1_0072d04192 [Mucor ambiguus]